MKGADATPMPVEVAIPSAPGSNPGMTLEASQERRVHSSRGLMQALVFTGATAVATAVALVGPEAHDALNNYHQSEAQERIAVISKQEVPRSLRGAQSAAQGELFGEGKDAHEKLETMLKEARSRVNGTEWQLPAGQFVSPDQVRISEDGKSVEIGGQSISFAQIRSEGGNYYIVAARPVHEDRMFSKDRTHMVHPMLIGGAKYDEKMTGEELLAAAYGNARHNLTASLEQYHDREFAEGTNLNNDELIAQK